MRRIITILILVFILIFVGSRILKKKPVQQAVKKTQEVAEGSKRARRAGRKTGGLEKREKKSKEERRKERELRKLERKRLKEERKRQRELQKLQRQKKKRSRKKKAGMYILQAIVTVENTPYALIDGKQYKVGDEIMGRRIVKIDSDKITLDYFGEITTVRVGEGCVPLTTLKTPKRK
ncbi:MAG: hypothetical protein ABIK56_00935 [candidate division WOR-3 bacterium]